MSQDNPYQASAEPASPHPIPGEAMVRKVQVRPIELLQRGYALLGEQYLLMVGVTLVAMLVGSLVPMGLILGALLVGIYFCCMQREQFGRTEFGTLFKGFDFFVESLLVMLMSVGLSLVVLIPTYIIGVVGMFAILAIAGGDEATVGVALMIGFPIFFLLVLMASVAIYLPFLFAFQAIADRHLKALDAVKLSWQGMKRNFFGVLFHMFVVSAISMLAALMCYVPVFFFLPISFASMFVLYRDIFGPGTFAPPPLTAVGPPMQPGPMQNPPAPGGMNG